LLYLGKAAPDFMEKVVFKNLGYSSESVKVGPGIGLDNGVVNLGKGRSLVVTVDPVSAVPAIGMKTSAWLSVHLVASDFTTSGARPQYATLSYNFPPDMSASDAETYVRAVGKECRRLGISIVGGHTGSYKGGDFTVIGACTMLGICGDREYVVPSMAEHGDMIYMTKHAAIETTAYLAWSFPNYLSRTVGASVTNRAKGMIKLCTTVRDAVTAAKVGLRKKGVTSMHDVTEGGVLGSLREMASASGRAFVVRADRIPVSLQARRVCSVFGIDPLTSLGEGSLLITCKPGTSRRLERLMWKAGIKVTVIGAVTKGEGLWVSKGAKPRRWKATEDGYWKAYAASANRGLD
jgi:hydrogenase expression/formation protein HypE